MGNKKQLKRVYLVAYYNIDADSGTLEETIEEMFFFANQKVAEQHACHLIQETIEDQSTLEVSDEEDAEIAFKINEMISKENYAGAIKAFNDWAEDFRYGEVKMIVMPLDMESPEKPKVFEKDFFVGLPDPEQVELKKWQDEVRAGITKLGFDSWKKEQAA